MKLIKADFFNVKTSDIYADSCVFQGQAILYLNSQFRTPKLEHECSMLLIIRPGEAPSWKPLELQPDPLNPRPN
jgi:hypothetical protein